MTLPQHAIRELTAEQATTLAALRWYHHSGMGEPANRPDWLHDIACPTEDATSLDDAGIDVLCETILAV